MGASNAEVICRNCDSELISDILASLRAVNAATGQVLSTRRRRTMVPQVVTFIAAGSKRRSLLMAGDDDEMFMTKVSTLRQQHLTALSDKSVACVVCN